MDQSTEFTSMNISKEADDREGMLLNIDTIDIDLQGYNIIIELKNTIEHLKNERSHEPKNVTKKEFMGRYNAHTQIIKTYEKELSETLITHKMTLNEVIEELKTLGKVKENLLDLLTKE